MIRLMIALFAFLVLASVHVSSSVAPANTNFMSCMFCDTVTDAFDTENTPTGVIQAMFRKCNRMGLMEPICDNFISHHAKQIIHLARAGTPTSEICQKLLMCDGTK